jgi:hypothetical protein
MTSGNTRLDPEAAWKEEWDEVEFIVLNQASIDWLACSGIRFLINELEMGSLLGSLVVGRVVLQELGLWQHFGLLLVPGNTSNQLSNTAIVEPS